jgi:gamma-glutamyltranspeptidase/glutathione hydrolase
MVGTRAEVRSAHGVVSAGHPLAVEAGLGALEQGGNAVDAVVAGAFAAFVAEPNNAGIGGYGHLSAFLADDASFLTVDHGPRAPARAREDMFDVEEGPLDGHDWPSVSGHRNFVGHLAPAVPGAVAGLWDAHRSAGQLDWPLLLESAIAIAEAGLEVTWVLLIEIAARQAEIATDRALAEMLLPDGRLPRARSADEPGDRLNQRALAETLRRIAREGPDAFYHGTVATAIGDAVAAGGGILSAEDLVGYGPKVVHEQPATYRGLQLVTANDTVGSEALGILEHFPLGEFGPGSVEHYHLLAEAMGHAFADNASYACDPDFTSDPVHELGQPEFAAARAAAISLQRAVPRPIEATAPWLTDERAKRPASIGGVHGTTQVVAGDSDGNLAALITTIGADFGSVVGVPGTGIVLNNSMVNYDPRPGRSNSIAPGKMPFFAVPAIVAARDGRAAFAAAGSGGYAILAGVINTIVGVVDHGLGVQAAIDLPRVHSQGNRTYIDSRVGFELRAGLERLGHDLVVQPVTPGELPLSRVSAIKLQQPGSLTAGAGPAWNTAAGGLCAEPVSNTAAGGL